MKNLLKIFAILLLASSCKKQVERSTVSYVIGDNNMKVLEFNSEVFGQFKSAINSTALIVTETDTGSKKYCSGVLVQGANTQKILTNHHCFAVPGQNGLATENLIPTACRETTVYFNMIEGVQDSATSAECIEGSLITDFAADLATFSISGTLPENAKPIPLMTDSDVAGRAAFIIHYPVESSKLVYVNKFGGSFPLATITYEDCKVIGKFPQDEWKQIPVLSVSHRHTCDLIQGSSGSPLIDLETNRLLGVNWGGIKVQSGGDLRVDNAATSAAYATQFLQHQGAPNTMASNLQSLVTQSKQETSKEVKKPVCGSIGILKESGFPTVLALLLPFIVPLYIRKTKV